MGSLFANLGAAPGSELEGFAFVTPRTAATTISRTRSTSINKPGQLEPIQLSPAFGWSAQIQDQREYGGKGLISLHALGREILNGNCRMDKTGGHQWSISPLKGLRAEAHDVYVGKPRLADRSGTPA